jgi:hypothetical protein
MAAKTKGVSLLTRGGTRVSFGAKAPARKVPPRRRKASRAMSRQRAKTRRDTERLIEAGLGYVNPVFSVIIAAGRVVEDLLKE